MKQGCFWMMAVAMLTVIACKEDQTIPSEPPSPSYPNASAERATVMGPRDTLERYLKARLLGNWAEDYQWSDTTASLEDYELNARRRAPLAQIIGEVCEFDIEDLRIVGDQGEAKVLIKMPDLSPYIQRLIMTGVKADLLGERTTYEPIIDSLTKAIQQGDFKLLTQAQKFLVVQRERGWRVQSPGESKDHQ